MVAEIVREKILQTTQEEIPYVTAVVVEKWEEEREDFTRIHCAIFVERGSQKKIVIGKGAARLKEIGIAGAAGYRKPARPSLPSGAIRKG